MNCKARIFLLTIPFVMMSGAAVAAEALDVDAASDPHGFYRQWFPVLAGDYAAFNMQFRNLVISHMQRLTPDHTVDVLYPDEAQRKTLPDEVRKTLSAVSEMGPSALSERGTKLFEGKELQDRCTSLSGADKAFCLKEQAQAAEYAVALQDLSKRCDDDLQEARDILRQINLSLGRNVLALQKRFEEKLVDVQENQRLVGRHLLVMQDLQKVNAERRKAEQLVNAKLPSESVTSGKDSSDSLKTAQERQKKAFSRLSNDEFLEALKK